ncbi:hypothetical protein ACVIEM_005102 [Rhizobium leguminosarum]
MTKLFSRFLKDESGATAMPAGFAPAELSERAHRLNGREPFCISL